MSEEFEPADLTNEIAKALGVPIVTHYVVVANCIGEDGDQQVHDLSSPGMLYWQKYGLLGSSASSYEGQPLWSVEEDEG